MDKVFMMILFDDLIENIDTIKNNLIISSYN